MKLAGKCAIVSGGTMGIGLAIARRLGMEGAKIIVTSRKTENVEKATEKLRIEGIEVKGLVSHIADPNDRRKMFEKASEWGKLDILVLNAGVNPAFAPILDTPETAWDKIFDVNLKAAFMATKEALPLIRLSNSGRIIYSSTIASYFHIENLGAYAISKIALLGLTKMVAIQLGRENITVNCVTPGLIDTRFAKVLTPTKESEAFALSTISLGR